MSELKAIFDRKLVRARRARGEKQNGDPFLLRRAAQDAGERLLDINRVFDDSLVLANPAFAQKLSQIAGHKLRRIVAANHSNYYGDIDISCAETALPFADQSFDVLINGLSLHGVNNAPRAIKEMKRVLKPDGLLIIALFGGSTLQELRHTLYETEDVLYGHISPRVSPMISMHQAAGLLQSAGMAMPVIDRDLVQVSYRSLSALYKDLRLMGETNALLERSKASVSKRFFTSAEHIYKRGHTNLAGKLTVSFDIIWLTGWTPHPDQQKPLKPGSAKTSLASALGVQETQL